MRFYRSIEFDVKWKMMRPCDPSDSDSSAPVVIPAEFCLSPRVAVYLVCFLCFAAVARIIIGNPRVHGISGASCILQDISYMRINENRKYPSAPSQDANANDNADEQKDSIIMNNITKSNDKAMSDAAAFLDGMDCLKYSQSPIGYPNFSLKPFKEREQHYYELLNRTLEYREVPCHCWKGYCGPWSEEIFIAKLSNLPYSEFGPFIPVFVNWLDYWKHIFLNSHIYITRINDLFASLRPDMLYITVSMHDQGIQGWRDQYIKLPKNLIIISSSGVGHIPYFYFGRLLYPIEFAKPSKYSLCFMGSVDNQHREKIAKMIKKMLPRNAFVGRNAKEWQKLYAESKVILSPRGYAVGCFRHSEILQMGGVAFFSGDVNPWVPYLHSKLPTEKMWFYSSDCGLSDMIQRVGSIPDEVVDEMRANVLKYRESHFTPNGATRQILAFMRGGFGESDLRCDKYRVWRNPGEIGATVGMREWL